MGHLIFSKIMISNSLATVNISEGSFPVSSVYFRRQCCQHPLDESVSDYFLQNQARRLSDY